MIFVRFGLFVSGDAGCPKDESVGTPFVETSFRSKGYPSGFNLAMRDFPLRLFSCTTPEATAAA